MANNQVITGIKVDSAADDNKVPVYDAVTDTFVMETPSSGGAGWKFVSYGSSTSGITLTISSLDLATDKSYKIIYQVQSDGSTNNPYMRINGSGGSNYYSAGYRTYLHASAGSEIKSQSGQTLWYIQGGDAYKSYAGEMIFNISKLGTAGAARVVYSHSGMGLATGTDTYFQNINNSGFNDTQTNMTSLTLALDGGTNANIYVWVFKVASS